MSLFVPDNERKPWSKITDTRIIRPRDELKLVGLGFTAVIGVLDSHDPSSEQLITLGQFYGLEAPPVEHHHHILVQLEGQSDVMPTGLWVGVGEPDDLLACPHISRRHFDDEAHQGRLERLHQVLSSGIHGLYFISEQEPLSATPEGRMYVDDQGNLLK